MDSEAENKQSTVESTEKQGAAHSSSGPADSDALSSLRLRYKDLYHRIAVLQRCQHAAADLPPLNEDVQLRLEEQLEQLHREAAALCEKAVSLPALSLNEMRTKAVMLLNYCDAHEVSIPSKLTISLCEDVERLAQCHSARLSA